MDEAGVKLLMSLCYRAGIKDGWDGKELPTLKQLDNMVNEVYHNYITAGTNGRRDSRGNLNGNKQ